MKKIWHPQIMLGQCSDKLLPPTTPTTTTFTVLGPDGFAAGKTAKKAKSWKITKPFFCDFWQRYCLQRAEILHSTFCHQYLHLFYKFFCILHKSDNTKVAPTTTTTIPRSRLRHGPKNGLVGIRTRKFDLRMGANQTCIRKLADSQPILLICIDSQFARHNLRVGE